MTSKAMRNVQSIFEGVDERDWNKIQAAMADKVLLDFTSLAGGKPARLSPERITADWATVLTGFDKTHHQLSNFKVAHKAGKSYITFDGKTDHLLDGATWTVTGNYFVETGPDDKVSFIRFNVKQATGDSSLPQKARNAKRTNKL